jgi:hypothetical protein
MNGIAPGKRAHRALGSLVLLLGAVALVGCPSTMFIDEGTGQPGDRASGFAPPGSIGACRLLGSKRPPIVEKELWDHLRVCNKRTPHRYVRIGYGEVLHEDTEDDRQMKLIMAALGHAYTEVDGNVKMLRMLRAVQQAALHDEELASRVDRWSGRTYACDYTYLFGTTEKTYSKLGVGEDPCPAYVFDPKLRRDVCLFDLSVKEAKWLESAWDCLAFTDTLGEGESCHRMCAFDDYCSAQVSCARGDFDLVLCGLGVCMPERRQGIF